MNTGVGSSGHGDFATVPVPADARRSMVIISLNLAGGPICVAALFAGSALGGMMPLVNCAAAAVLGGIVALLFGGVLGVIGSRQGLSTGMLARHTFGTAGSKLVSLVLAVCLVGWYAVQTSLFGATIHSLYPEGGTLTAPHVAAAWGGLLMLTTAYFGFQGLTWLSIFSVPLLVVLCIFGVAKAASGVDLLAYNPATPRSLSEGVTLVVGTLAVGATTIADVARYARRPAHSWIACGVSFVAVNALMLLAGAATLIATGAGDLPKAMLALGLGVPALLIVILGQWTTNDDNLYSASLGAAAALPSVSKHVLVLVFGVGATVIGAWGAAELLIPFLMFLGVLIPPIGGVLIADHMLLRSRSRPAETFSPAGFTAWTAGTLAGFLLPFGIGAVNAILAALIVFSTIRLVGSPTARQLEYAES